MQSLFATASAFEFQSSWTQPRQQARSGRFGSGWELPVRFGAGKAVDGEKAKIARGLAVLAEHVRDLRRISWAMASAALLALRGINPANVGLSTR